MLDWIHLKFLKWNFLQKIGLYVAQGSQTQLCKMPRPALQATERYSWVFLELCTESQCMEMRRCAFASL